MVLRPNAKDGIPMFNPLEVAIVRHRLSTTQGEVSVSYAGEKLGRFGDTIELIPGGSWEGRDDAAWIEVARRIVEARPRIIATFVPQAWINDHAVDVDPEGDTEWDVTGILVGELSREEMGRLKDNRDETDTLRDEDPAPEWVRAWRGPFYVRVQDSIADYLAATGKGA